MLFINPHLSLHLAYIGPGAGFAVLGSFLSILLGLLAGAVSLLTLPFRIAWKVITRRGLSASAKARKLIFLGLDGLDPRLTERFMEEGKLPNFARLKNEGSYSRLRTTFPALSPVAWSTFATGVSPARHNIFDFLNRSLKSYLPELSSAKVYKPRRIWKIGGYRIALSKPYIEMRRKSQTFWKVLGEHDIPSTVLRVPISFPPEKFNGRLLSAMCTPDLLGTQGSFTQFTTRPIHENVENGRRCTLVRDGQTLRGTLEGPEDFTVESSPTLKVPFALTMDETRRTARIRVGRETIQLHSGEYSEWIPVRFRTALGGRIRGICRLLITELEPETSIYVTPINIDPEHPALPISHPASYATYLARLLGTYSTLGMAEDTWALNEGVIGEKAFLRQAYQIFEEREKMFFSALQKTKRGVLACVFDTTDRIQHMFWRTCRDGQNDGAIEQLYIRMDRLVGETLKNVDADTVLFVLSDHGFASFDRCVNLNSWLLQNGYLTLREGVSGAGHGLHEVDWSRTRAYAIGLSGIYINQRGREAHGMVARGRDCEALKQELVLKLSGLRDSATGRVAINQAVTADSIYHGPYLDAAPDILIGFNSGYRYSWDSALGRTSAEIFEDNRKAWSGDHCIDPTLVPGILFCNRKVEAQDPGIEDLAPTALHLFGCKVPAYMEGKPVL